MHGTLERIQVDATPAVNGPLRVYFVFSALVVTALTTDLATHVAAMAAFALLSVHAVGRAYVRLLRYPLSFLLSSLLLIAITLPGEPVAEFWVLTVSARGIDVAAATGVRAVASLSVLSFLVLTTTAPQLVAALDGLRLPAPIVELLLLVYRGIQVLIEQSARLTTAARLRGGFTSRRSLFRTTKLIGASLLVSSIDRAEAVGTAMEARNYAGEMPVPGYESNGHAVVGAVFCLLVAARWLT